ncbi:MAG: tetratricopeptide repeat protein, partial [Chloroflexi bacterium]
YPAASAGLAEAYLGQGRDADALRQWQILTATHPDWPGVFTGLGRVRLRQLAFDEARRAFLAQQAHSFDPEAEWYLAVLDSAVDLPRARARLEGLASRTDLPPELAARLDYLQDTLDALPAGADTLAAARQVGIAMVQAQEWPLAVYALESARQALAAPDGELLAFLGYARARAGAPALELFERARQADPRSSLPLYFEGIYLREQKALQAAEDRLAQAIALDPENAALFLEYARVREAMGDLATAEAAHLKAVELAGDDTAFRLALVDFYARHSYRVREAAIPAARALVEAEPDNAEAYSLLGWLELLNGQSTAAEKSLRRALELDPELVSARYHLGRLLEAVGQTELARREYQHVVDWDFAGIYRDDALKALQRLNR